ncbi:MAG: 2-oxoacid:acceptor oxidoreductase subunit alpha [Betaproteobacteria bacterium]|nr:2-oxoacid:acceptor oxidoreductase subunit alpha [Betaproteobacteria bacterium]
MAEAVEGAATARRAPAAKPAQGIDLRQINAVRAAIQDGRLTQARRTTLGGNDAIAQAALEAGARFFGGYPITPSTEVLEYAARHILGVGGSYLQMEDEIAGIAAAIGASLGGVKAFTATSGPGFSLKQENLGYACLVEIPLVVINVMRGGPSTGGPTDPGQSDVMQARWGTHGDHPIVAIAPATVQECWEETVRAFNISEKYRTPVILLPDAKVGQMKEPVILPPLSQVPIVNRPRPTGAPEEYEAFGQTASGVPPLAPFGEGYRSHFTGLYHNRKGLPTKDVRLVDQLQKRIHAKLETREARADILKTEEFFAADAEILVVAYGITARAAKDAVLEARAQGIKAGLLRPITLWPSDPGRCLPHLARAKRVIVAELNLGQYRLEVERLAYEAARAAGKVPTEVLGLNRVDTRLITPRDIFQEIAR